MQTMRPKFSLIFVTCLLSVLEDVSGHGMLVDPPARNVMWRYQFPNPVNWNDNQLYCGGYSRQWIQNGGKCGFCGDPYDAPRDHEAGGRFANGIITRTYQQGEIINVRIELTANHQGYFRFKLCPVNNYKMKVTQSCLDKYPLLQLNGESVYPVTGTGPKNITVSLVLPKYVTCTQCVLQWFYNTGNSWGCPVDGECCGIGCGKQEQYYNCADIEIRGDKTQQPIRTTPWSVWTPRPTTPRPTTSWPIWPPRQTTRRPIWTPKPTTPKWPQTSESTKAVIPDWLKEADEFYGKCRAIIDSEDSSTHLWCLRWCYQGVCPQYLCNDDCRKAFKDKISLG